VNRFQFELVVVGGGVVVYPACDKNSFLEFGEILMALHSRLMEIGRQRGGASLRCCGLRAVARHISLWRKPRISKNQMISPILTIRRDGV
jgi:hypothetical protein